MTTRTVRPSAALFLIFTAGYFLSYFLRSANAVLAPQLQRDVGLGPAELGLMTSLFFGAYAVAQIPVGFALDRWGPRGVGTSLLGLGVVGAVLFSLGNDLFTLALARVLLGVGTGSTLLAGLKAFALWWPPGRFATVAGAFISGGSLGALVAAEPLALLSDAVGWRASFQVSALVVAIVTAVVWFATPPVRTRASSTAGADDASRERTPDPRTDPAAVPQADPAGDPPVDRPGTGLALASVMLLGAAFTGPVVAFQTLWGGPYLFDGYGVDAATVGRYLLVLSVGVSAGFGLSGAIADRLGLRVVTIGAAFGFAVAQLALAAVEPGRTPMEWLLPLYAVYGVLGGHCVLVLSNARSLLDVERSGRATGFVNGSSIGGVFLVQWLVGVVVEEVGGAGGYRVAWLGSAALTLLAALAMAWALRRVDRPGGPSPAATARTMDGSDDRA